jgi:HEAT repeat protein
VPESALLEPLLDADAGEMAPLLIGEIAAKNMVRRRYAIEYLGRIQSKPALPALETILADASEADVFRADALGAIAAIDRTRAQRHANTYRDSRDSLGKLCRQLLAENPAVVGALQ